MSTVFVHVGQAGNQIGQAFWVGHGTHNNLPLNPFIDDVRWVFVCAGCVQIGGRNFLLIEYTVSHGVVCPPRAQHGKARCLLVDSEPKVVAATLLKTSRALGAKDDRDTSLFRKANVCFDQSGRGNNWALGYFGKDRREGTL
jgi:hypothetical protein